MLTAKDVLAEVVHGMLTALVLGYIIITVCEGLDSLIKLIKAKYRKLK